VEDVGGRRGEGSGRHGPNAGRPRPLRRRRGGYGAASRKERRRSEGGDRVRRARRSHGTARPRASRLRARGAGAEQEQRAGDATRHDGPAGGYAGVPAVFRQHTCVSRGGSAREQEDLEVRGGVGIANQSGSIVSSQGSMTSSSSYPSLIAQPTTVTTGHRGDYPSGHPPPPTTFPLASFFVAR
jgi:hypothetical protein